jgi:hypothetical protein
VVYFLSGMMLVTVKVSHAGSLLPDDGGDIYKVSRLGILFSQV